jgi:prepilin peptidase CpaA
VFDQIILILALLTYCGFLIIAMIGDVKSFTISNRLNLFFFLSFIPFALMMGFDFKQILAHFWVAAIGFGICFILFTLGLFGGGDVKLVGATCFWLGAQPSYTYALFTALFGGILAIILLIARKIIAKRGLPRKPKWLRSLLRKRVHIPYGVALALGGIIAIGQAKWLMGINLG